MSAYDVRNSIAQEIASNAKNEALLSDDERLALARNRRDRMIAAAFGVPDIPGYTLKDAGITIEIGDEVLTLTRKTESVTK